MSAGPSLKLSLALHRPRRHYGALCISFALCCALCCLSFFSSAQRSDFFKFHSLSQKEGLYANTNAFVYQDRYGFVWISSVDGLNRFDGHRIRRYKNFLHKPYGENIQSNFFEDEIGDLWFSTNKSVTRFNRYNGQFESYFVQKDSTTYVDVVYHIFYLDTTNHHLWLKAADDVFIFNTENKQSNYLHSTKAVRFGLQHDYLNHKKNLISCFWRIQNGVDVVEYDNQYREIRHSRLFYPSSSTGQPSLVIQGCLVQNDSICWLNTDQGLVCLNTAKPNSYKIYKNPTDKGCHIRSICQQSDEDLLVGTTSCGVWRFSTTQGSYHKHVDFYNTEGINKDIIGIHTAKDATLWFSALGEGIIFGAKKEDYQQALLKKERVTHIAEFKNGDIWCMNKAGQMRRISKKDGQYTFLTPSSKRFQIEHLLSTNTLHGAKDCLTKKERENDFVNALLRLNPTCSVPISKEEYYVGTFDGLYYANTHKKEVKIVQFTRKGIYRLFIDSKHNVWVYGDGTLDVVRPNSALQPVVVHKYLNLGLVNHITEKADIGRIFIGSSGGLKIIDNSTFKDTLITEKTGLPNHYIYAVVPDTLGNLWLSSNEGIIKYMPQMPKGEQFRQYTIRNGLTSNEYCPGAGILSSKGEIWFGSTQGLDVFHPYLNTGTTSAPQLAIVGLKVHDKEWYSDTVCIEMAQRIELNYDQNTLRLELAAMEYTDPEMNKFRVWLSKDGGKPDTVELGTQNFITYANLRHGRYTFGFTACNSEGIWQKTPRYLEIVILPHFSDTLWFKVLIAVLALAVIGFSTAFYYRYRLRVQQLEIERQQREADRKQLLLENELALQQERNRIADEMHDELGGGLSTIRLASERSKKMESSEELKTILGRVSQISIGLISNMRGIIWAMDTQNDSLDSLLSYLRQYARTFLDDNAIEAHIQVPTERPDINLSGQYRHSILLTVKECLNNILKHAEATEVWLHTSVGEQLVIHIRDNGKGFDPEEKAGSGKGLRTTVKRMESIGGSIEWVRNEEGGMTTILKAPLRPDSV